MTWCRLNASVLCLLFSACGTQSPLPNPEIHLPESYKQSCMSKDDGPSPTTTDSRLWWLRFDSQELTDLVEHAQRQSLDIGAAVARVRQAEARTRIAGATLFPELDASVNASRQGDLGGATGDAGRLYGAGFNASYEVDFWGRNRALRDQARAEWQASRFARDTVRLTVTASAARLWLQAVAENDRINLAQENLVSAERLLDLVTARYRAGAASPLELAQQRGLVATQQRMLSALIQQRDAVRIALDQLLGQAGGVSVPAVSLSSLTVPAIEPGIPANLLVRRPDIGSAEARLRAANANVAVARAALFPRIALTGGVSVSRDQLQGLFDNPVYSLVAGLTAPVFNAGRLSAQHDLTQAEREELLVNYRRSIVSAFGDVEVALNAITGLENQAHAQAEELAQAKASLMLAEARYKAGADSLLTLLDAQRTLYAAQDAAVQIKGSHLQAIVSLYQALGGGWLESDSDNS